jgi:hypothetical protein
VNKYVERRCLDRLGSQVLIRAREVGNDASAMIKQDQGFGRAIFSD